MPDWLFERSTVVGLAAIGGVLAILASWCRSRNWVAEERAEFLNKASYAFMAASVFLFIGAGLLGVEK